MSGQVTVQSRRGAINLCTSGVYYSAKPWVHAVLTKLAPLLKEVKIVYPGQSSHTIGATLSLKELVWLTCNEKENVTGVINWGLYKDIDQKTILTLKDLMREVKITGLVEATAYGGYPVKSNPKVQLPSPQPTLVCNAIGLQFQRPENTGRLFLVAPPGSEFPPGVYDNEIFGHITGGMQRCQDYAAASQDASGRFEKVELSYVAFEDPKEYYFDTWAYQASIANDFINDALMLEDVAGKVKIQKLHFKFLQQGMGAFAEQMVDAGFGAGQWSSNGSKELNRLLQKHIGHGILKGLQKLFAEYDVSHIKTIELPFFPVDVQPNGVISQQINTLCQQQGVRFVISNNDALKPSDHPGEVVAPINNADQHAAPGNEYRENASVDAQIALNLKCHGNSLSLYGNTSAKEIVFPNPVKQVVLAAVPAPMSVAASAAPGVGSVSIVSAAMSSATVSADIPGKSTSRNPVAAVAAAKERQAAAAAQPVPMSTDNFLGFYLLSKKDAKDLYHTYLAQQGQAVTDQNRWRVQPKGQRNALLQTVLQFFFPKIAVDQGIIEYESGSHGYTVFVNQLEYEELTQAIPRIIQQYSAPQQAAASSSAAISHALSVQPSAAAHYQAVPDPAGLTQDFSALALSPFMELRSGDVLCISSSMLGILEKFCQDNHYEGNPRYSHPENYQRLLPIDRITQDLHFMLGHEEFSRLVRYFDFSQHQFDGQSYWVPVRAEVRVYMEFHRQDIAERLAFCSELFAARVERRTVNVSALEGAVSPDALAIASSVVQSIVAVGIPQSLQQIVQHNPRALHRAVLTAVSESCSSAHTLLDYDSRLDKSGYFIIGRAMLEAISQICAVDRNSPQHSSAYASGSRGQQILAQLYYVLGNGFGELMQYFVPGAMIYVSSVLGSPEYCFIPLSLAIKADILRYQDKIVEHATACYRILKEKMGKQLKADELSKWNQQASASVKPVINGHLATNWPHLSTCLADTLAQHSSIAMFDASTGYLTFNVNVIFGIKEKFQDAAYDWSSPYSSYGFNEKPHSDQIAIFLSHDGKSLGNWFDCQVVYLEENGYFSIPIRQDVRVSANQQSIVESVILFLDSLPGCQATAKLTPAVELLSSFEVTQAEANYFCHYDRVTSHQVSADSTIRQVSFQEFKHVLEELLGAIDRSAEIRQVAGGYSISLTNDEKKAQYETIFRTRVKSARSPAALRQELQERHEAAQHNRAFEAQAEEDDQVQRQQRMFANIEKALDQQSQTKPEYVRELEKRREQYLQARNASTVKANRFAVDGLYAFQRQYEISEGQIQVDPEFQWYELAIILPTLRYEHLYQVFQDKGMGSEWHIVSIQESRSSCTPVFSSASIVASSAVYLSEGGSKKLRIDHPKENTTVKIQFKHDFFMSLLREACENTFVQSAAARSDYSASLLHGFALPTITPTTVSAPVLSVMPAVSVLQAAASQSITSAAAFFPPVALAQPVSNTAPVLTPAFLNHIVEVQQYKDAKVVNQNDDKYKGSHDLYEQLNRFKKGDLSHAGLEQYIHTTLQKPCYPKMFDGFIWSDLQRLFEKVLDLLPSMKYNPTSTDFVLTDQAGKFVMVDRVNQEVPDWKIEGRNCWNEPRYIFISADGRARGYDGEKLGYAEQVMFDKREAIFQRFNISYPWPSQALAPRK